MNTNQIPPGIVAFKNHGGYVHTIRDAEEYHGRVIEYAEWVKSKLFSQYHAPYTIHTISVDGTEWSVGEDAKQGKIESFGYADNNRWVARFADRSSVYADTLTKPLPHSGGELKEMIGMVDQLNKILFPDKATNQGEAGGKSKDEQRFGEYTSEERLKALRLAATEIQSLKQQLKEESHRCKVLVDNLMVVTNLKEKQGWSDEDLGTALGAGYMSCKLNLPLDDKEWIANFKTINSKP